MDDWDFEASGPITEKFYPRRDYVCTEAYASFIKEYKAHILSFFFIAHLAGVSDRTRVNAARALALTAKDPAEKELYEKQSQDHNQTVRALQKYSTVTSQNLTNGVVNAFQRYFSSLIQSVAIKRPQVMTSSKDQIRVEEVLRFTRHRDLVAYLIDKKINSLSYGGLDDLERYFDDRLNILMFQNEREKSLMRLFIEARNINVHNGGIINDIFIQRVGEVDGFPYKKGRIFHVDFDSLILLSENAMTVAQSIDTRVREKFDLRKKAIASWHKEKGDVPSPSPSKD